MDDTVVVQGLSKNILVVDGFIYELLKHNKLKKMKLFGVGIDSYMVMQKAVVKFLNVPILVRLCADQIILRALKLEGIFRVPGSHDVINEISLSFENGMIPDFSEEVMGIEEVTGAFKKYLRELPQPLFSDDSPDNKLANRLSEVLLLESPKEKIIRLRHLIKKLSLFKRALIKELFYILYLVSLEHKANLMDARNLSTIFGEMVDIISNTMSARSKADLCTFLITYFPSIFHAIDEIPPVSNTASPGSKLSRTGRYITIYFDDGTFKSMFIHPTTTCAELTQNICAKLSQNKIDGSMYSLYELRDRYLRVVDRTEPIFPYTNRTSLLLFSGKIDGDNLYPHIPVNDEVTQIPIDENEEEELTEEEPVVENNAPLKSSQEENNNEVDGDAPPPDYIPRPPREEVVLDSPSTTPLRTRSHRSASLASPLERTKSKPTPSTPTAVPLNRTASSIKGIRNRSSRLFKSAKKHDECIDELLEHQPLNQESLELSNDNILWKKNTTDSLVKSLSIPDLDTTEIPKSPHTPSSHTITIPTLQELVQRVERIPDNFDLITPNRRIIQQDECSVKFNDDKKWRPGCLITVMNDILFIHSLHTKKFGRKVREIFEGVFSLCSAVCTVEEHVIKITSGNDSLFINDLANMISWIANIEYLITNFKSEEQKEEVVPKQPTAVNYKKLSSSVDPEVKVRQNRSKSVKNDPIEIKRNNKSPSSNEKRKGAQSAKKERGFISLRHRNSESDLSLDSNSLNLLQKQYSFVNKGSLTDRTLDSAKESTNNSTPRTVRLYTKDEDMLKQTHPISKSSKKKLVPKLSGRNRSYSKSEISTGLSQSTDSANSKNDVSLMDSLVIDNEKR